MDKGFVFERIEQSCTALKIDLSSTEMEAFADENAFSREQLAAVKDLFCHLEEKNTRPWSIFFFGRAVCRSKCQKHWRDTILSASTGSIQTV